MKRCGFLKRKTPLRIKGISETSEVKQRIQDLVRAIVIKRDGGCILRDDGVQHMNYLPPCNGFAKDGHLILQADHLITRANSATYADTRLIVCVCKGHHGWKKWHEREYNALVRTLLSPERVKLWDDCERDSWRPHRTSTMDWKLQEAALQSELRALQ
jgi:hypothetical protein